MAEKKTTTKKAAPKVNEEALVVEAAEGTVEVPVETTEESVEETVETPAVEPVAGEVENTETEEVSDAATELTPENIEKIEKALSEVDAEIKADAIEKEVDELNKELEESIDKVAEISDKVAQITDEKKLDGIVEKDPEEAKALIETEIKKAEDLKNEIKGKINETPKKKVSRPANVTSWWNGMGYDF